MKRVLLSVTAVVLAAACTSADKKTADSSPHGRAVASAWTNLITCDDGLRIDEDVYDSHQIVLFGPALDHFVQFGAIPKNSVNAQGEFVSSLSSEQNMYVVQSPRGQLATSTSINRSNPNTSVWWRAIGDGRDTDYKFNRCH